MDNENITDDDLNDEINLESLEQEIEEDILLDDAFTDQIDLDLERFLDLTELPFFKEIDPKLLPFTGNQSGEAIKAFEIFCTDDHKNVIILFKAGGRHWVTLRVWKKNKEKEWKQRSNYNISQLNLGTVIRALIHIESIVFPK